MRHDIYIIVLVLTITAATILVFSVIHSAVKEISLTDTGRNIIENSMSSIFAIIAIFVGYKLKDGVK